MKSYKDLVTNLQVEEVNIEEETHSELARAAASKYRTALARGDSVGASQANAERMRHKKAAQVLKQKSHTPGVNEEVQLDEVAPVDLDKYFAGVETKVAEKKPAAKKEPEQTITGSQIKFFKNVKEEVEVNEAKDTVVRDKTGKLISFKHEGDWKKSDPKKNPEGKVHNLAGQALKKAQNLNKEEVESIDEAKVETKKYSWGTMKTIHKGASYSIPLHPEHHEHIAKMKDGQVHDIKTEDGRQWHVKREGDTVHFHGANGGPKTSVPHSSLKESVELEEAFVNGREYASHGLMHPTHAAYPLHKVSGHNIDFYAHGTGDKVEGKVTKNDGKAVHIKDTSGKTHKFKVTPHLPKQQNESHAPVAPTIDRKYIKGTPEWKAHKEKSKPINGHPTNVRKEDVAFDEEGNLVVEKKSYHDFMTSLLEYEVDKNGRYVHKGTYGSAYKDPEGADDADDKPKKSAGRQAGSKVGPKKNLGNSKLHTK